MLTKIFLLNKCQTSDHEFQMNEDDGTEIAK